MKKILWTGALTTITIPVAAVVSCTTTYDLTKIDVDLVEMKSPQALIDKMNETMKFKMNTDAATLVKKDPGVKNDTQYWENIKAYMEAMKIGDLFKVKFNDKSYIIDLKPVKNAVANLLTFLNKPKEERMDNNEISDLIIKMMGLGAVVLRTPTLSEVLVRLTNQTYAMKLGKFLELGSKGATIDNHEYFELLRAWHKVIYDFTQSIVYKEWIVDKTFGFIIGGDPKIDTTIAQVKPGNMFDNITESDFLKKVENPDQINNFEALLIQNITNLTAIKN